MYANVILPYKTFEFMKLHGPGSRINHPEYGKGVITNVTALHYFVSFIETGIETIDLDSEFEVIESLNFDLDLVSFSEVESSLREILEKWSDVGPLVKMGERWKGGKLEIHPGDSTQSKEIPIHTKAPYNQTKICQCGKGGGRHFHLCRSDLLVDRNIHDLLQSAICQVIRPNRDECSSGGSKTQRQRVCLSADISGTQPRRGDGRIRKHLLGQPQTALARRHRHRARELGNGGASQ